MSQITLQSLVDDHLKRITTCRDGVMLCHAGLMVAGEDVSEQYTASLPPLPQSGEKMTYPQVSSQARAWLAANALRDLIMLHYIYFEQLRQFLCLADIAAGSQNEEEKMKLAQEMVQGRPGDAGAELRQLDELMQGGCPRKSEFHALETLYSLFAAQASGQAGKIPSEPVTVTLCLPKILKEDPAADGNVSYEVEQVTRTFTQPGQAELDRALLYEILFAAFLICRDTAETSAATVKARKAS